MQAVYVTLVMLVAITALGAVARRIAIPYPILFVVGGAGIALIPGLPSAPLDPPLFFALFLPPLLYSDGWLMPVREFRAQLRPILLLALGLVVVTTLTVGLTAHALLPELPLAVCFALGAVVSPTDTVAVSAIMERLQLPLRMRTILSGESLVNDASGLVAFRFAVAAAMTGSFSLWDAAIQFAALSAGGVAAGLAVSWAMGRARLLLCGEDDKDTLILITMSLLTPYAVYLAAEALQVSPVLAIVAAGLRDGYYDPVRMAPAVRMRAWTVWEMFLFLMNGLVFVLLGLQLPQVVRSLEDQSLIALLGSGLAIAAVAVAVRLAYVFPGGYLPRWIFPWIAEREGPLLWSRVFVVGWAGMRGTVTLAAALSLPLALPDGSPFPGRDAVIWLAFVVILTTLLVQGLTLPFWIRLFGVKPDDLLDREEKAARLAAAQAGRAHVEAALTIDGAAGRAYAERLLAEYDERLGVLRAEGSRLTYTVERLRAGSQLRRIALEAERTEIVSLRRSGAINDETLLRIQMELDVEETRIRGD